MGYLSEAMINALARLGWSHGDQEIFSVDELIEYFDLDAVGKSPAGFDADKLQRMNGRYIQQADTARLAELVGPFLARRGLEAGPDKEAVLLRALPEIAARAHTLDELAYWAEPYLRDQPEMEPKAVKKFLKPAAAPILAKVRDMVAEMGLSDLEGLENAVRDLARDMEAGLGKVAQPVRVSLTGRTASPGVFEVMAILGRDTVLARLERGIDLAAAGSENA
jgi:glutamyl-tRNA synthetase